MSQSDPTQPEARSLSSEIDEALGESSGTLLDTAFLVGLSGRHAGKLFRLRSGDNIIGRSSRSFLTLDEKGVSHQHALLHLSARGCIVSDLKSTNGTFVNDAKVTEPVPLHAGDVIHIGTSSLGFLTDAEDDEQHTRALARVTGGHHLVNVGAQVTSPNPAGLTPAGLTGSMVQVVSTTPDGGYAMAPQTSALDNALDKLSLVMGFLGTYWKLLLLCAAVLGTLGGCTVAFAPPQAVAEFEIFLRHDQTQNPTQHFASRGVDYFVSAEKNFSNPEVVRKTMADMEMPINENTVIGTARSLTFGTVGRSTYQGTYAHPDASFAEEFLAQHVKNYLEREIGKAIAVLQSEVDLLEEQYEENEDLLREKEAKLRDFKLKHLDTLPEQAAEQMSSRVALLNQRDMLSSDLERYTRELALSKKQLSSEDALVEHRVEQAAPYEEALATLRRQLATARAQGFTDEHPDIVKYKTEEKELLELRRQTIQTSATDTDRRANPEHKRLANRAGELEVAVAYTSKQLGLVQSRLADISKIAGDLPKVEANYAEITRQVASGQQLHTLLYEQLRAKQLELEFERASVAARYEIVAPPRALPVSLVKTSAKRATFGSFGGLMLGLGLALSHWLLVYAKKRRRKANRA